MPTTSIGLQRLRQQRLTHAPFDTPAEVVRWLCAAQSQDYLYALWSVGMRMAHATADVVDHAFDTGAMLRTHVMRPTWHFVTTDDIGWLLGLTAPRVHALNAYMYRQQELDTVLLVRATAVIADALRDGTFLTRAELGAALADAGIVAEGVRLAYIIMYAELEGVICSGPRRGKQFTYALLVERAPDARRLDRDEALAELVRRYFTGHGPATINNCAGWSGLSVADIKRGMAMIVPELDQQDEGGQTYWFARVAPPVAQASDQAFLLPTYDEYQIGYIGSEVPPYMVVESLRFYSTIVVGGHVIGSWRRVLKGRTVEVELAFVAPPTPVEHAAVVLAAERYGQFLGLPVRCVVV
jgi:hypothetical protein